MNVWARVIEMKICLGLKIIQSIVKIRNRIKAYLRWLLNLYRMQVKCHLDIFWIVEWTHRRRQTVATEHVKSKRNSKYIGVPLKNIIGVFLSSAVHVNELNLYTCFYFNISCCFFFFLVLRNLCIYFDLQIVIQSRPVDLYDNECLCVSVILLFFFFLWK